MYLKKLEIIGFKSFAKKTELHFDTGTGSHGITAIVGPNGSGKSNIADAARWVMGEQSLKLLRGKNAEDVIFSGSSSSKRMNFAEVSLYLDNSDKNAPIDYSHAVISRKIYRDGKNEYTINNTGVRLQDIVMLLAKSNIAVKNYAVIGQGMIDHVIRSSPYDRKDFFDEATGVKEFQLKRHRAFNHLANSSGHLEQVELLLTELKPRLKYLENQNNKYNKREELIKKLREFQLAYFGSLWNSVNKNIDEKSKEQKLLLAQSQKAEERLDEIQKETDILSQIKSGEEEYQKLQAELKHLHAKKSDLQKEQLKYNVAMEQEYEHKGKSDLAWIHHRKEELSHLLKNHKQKIQEIHGLLEKNNKLLKKKEEKKKEVDKKLEVHKKDFWEIKESLSKKDAHGHIKKALHDVLEMLNCLSLDIKQNKAQSLVIKTLQQINKKINDLNESLSVGAGFHIQSKLKIAEENLNNRQLEKEELIQEINDISFHIKVNTEKKEILEFENQRMVREIEDLAMKIEKTDKKNASELAEKIKATLNRVIIQLDETESNIEITSKKIHIFNQKQDEQKQSLLTLQKERASAQSQLDHINNFLSAVKIDIARMETKIESIKEEIELETDGALKEKIYALSSPGEATKELLPKILNIKKNLEYIGGIDQSVLEEYKECKERFTFLDEQSKDLREAIDSLKKIIKRLDTKIEIKFNKNLAIINKNFSHFFEMLFDGGKAILKKIQEEIPEETDVNKEVQQAEPAKESKGAKEKTDFPEENLAADEKKKKSQAREGIEIMAEPPGKKIRSISILSGGEKSLISIALVCAIISASPPPFVILDEVDAALDESNSLRFADIISELSKKTQFIAITHNRSTMEKSDILYGVTMKNDGISKLFSLKIEDALGAPRKIGF